ncbi:hypothetical protein M9H77_17642 [Catharanthus roseus]|uniref:Uncharacterized protein n=1 Tax=Catharanthus roseus TaxID=4058 RepID=A0ACC0B568_CATRO|nr:hypothetical protein M9H77_17642 [Catharanthus roseus]
MAKATCLPYDGVISGSCGPLGADLLCIQEMSSPFLAFFFLALEPSATSGSVRSPDNGRDCLTNRDVNGVGLTRTRAGLYLGKKIEKCHTGTGIPRPYPGPWKVGSGFKNFIPGGCGSESGSKFHYKSMDLGLGVP